MALRRIVRKVHGSVPSSERETYLIAGLGNPGPRYADTRHNLGFMVADELARQLPGGSWRERFQASYQEQEHNGKRLIIVRPLTYMNNSGQAIGQLVRWYHVPLVRLLVIYDELDLPYGRIRIRPSGSAGGHNGMSSIVRGLGSDQFPRLRIGIGRPVSGSTVDYVLSRFSSSERAELPELVSLATDATLAWLDDGIEAAMNEYNRRTVRRLRSAAAVSPEATDESSR